MASSNSSSSSSSSSPSPPSATSSSSSSSSSSSNNPNNSDNNININNVNNNNNYPRNENGDYVKHISGLEYYRNFLSNNEQIEILNLIYNNKWQEGIIARRQQFYGECYYHTSFKSKILQGASSAGSASGSAGSGTDENGTDNNNNNNNKDEDEDEDGTTTTTTTTTSDDDDDVELLVENKTGIDGHFPLNENENCSSSSSNMMKWLNKTMPYFKKELGALIDKPTQVLINEYKNNMGIASHYEDVQAFGPMICTISLISPIYMTLKKPTTTATATTATIIVDDNNIDNIDNGISSSSSNNNNNNNNNNNGNGNSNTNNSGNTSNACDVYDDVVKILLEPGSLLIMKSDARYKYRHGIGKYKWINIPSENNEDDEDDEDCDGDCDGDEENVNNENTENENDVAPTTTTTNSTINSSTTNSSTNNNIRRIKRDESYRRVSVTIRHLLSTRRKVYNDYDDESNTIKDPNVY